MRKKLQIKLRILIVCAVFIFGLQEGHSRGLSDVYVRVRGAQFFIGEKPYYYIGANFWAAMNLGSTVDGRARLIRELDRLKGIGINNLRIWGATEGPNSAPARVKPAVHESPGVYSEKLLRGLDFSLSEMHKRKMKAVICLNDFWHWSGGMAQFVSWATHTKIPYPPPAPFGSWPRYMKYTSKFYSNKLAMKIADDFVTALVTRKNSVRNIAYVDDPTIMSWELANEPRAMKNHADYKKWISHSAKSIKDMDPNHLVTIGSEGEVPYPSGINFIEDHSDPNVDYSTVHIWVQNFGWYNPAKPETYDGAFEKAKSYLAKHIEMANTLGKPIVLEEFGLARDKGSFDPVSTVNTRDQYFKYYFDQLLSSAYRKSILAGVNFWAWSGEATPKIPYGGSWKEGDDFLGDPPHEAQGWYSIYATDKSTLELIRSSNSQLGWIRWWRGILQ